MCIEAKKTFEVEYKKLSLHPSGLYILAAADSKVSFINILVGDLNVFKELPISKPRVLEFSNGGQYFAVANDRHIHIWDFFRDTAHPELTFTGHSKLGIYIY